VQSSFSSSEDDDSVVEKEPVKQKREYSVEFNLVWTTYNPHVPTKKGMKPAAADAHAKARKILTNDEILNALSLYMGDEYTFGINPAHLSTFLKGIITNTKYKEAYIDRHYEKTVQRQEGAYGRG